MADEDIDIEEHDVLDNPVIRSIFPDISVIKNEISQYYEDVPNIKQEPEINTICKKPSTDQITPWHPDEHVNDACKTTPGYLSTDIMGDSNVDNTQSLQRNKIIIGSKPSDSLKQNKDGVPVNYNQKPETVARIPKVVLQDLGTYIYQNNRYCKDCRTLFPSRSDLNVHLKKGHSIKRRNQQLNIKVILEKTTLEPNRNNKCNICCTNFSNKANLSRHYKNLHNKKVIFKSKYKLNKTANRMKNSCVTSLNKTLTKNKQGNKNETTMGKTSSEQKTHKCHICSSYFSCSSNLSRHYKNIHIKKVTFKPKYNKKNIPASGANNSSRAVNRTTRSRKNLESHNSTPGTDSVCFHCKKPFPDNKSLIEHIYEVLEPKRYPKEKVNNRPNEKENVTTSDWQKDGQNTSIQKGNEESFESKSFKHYLMFEDQDLDCSESLVAQEDNISDDVEAKVKRKKRENISTADELEKIQNNIAKEDNNNLDPCCSKILTNKRKSEYRDLGMKENQRPHKSNPLKRKRNYENQNSNPYGSHKTLDSNQNNKKQKLQNYESKNVNSKQKNKKSEIGFTYRPKETKNKKKSFMIEQLSIASDDKTMEIELKSNETDVKNTKERFVYECIYCSYMVPTSRAYYMHILGKHKVEKISHVNKVLFSEKCKYCPSTCRNESCHNSHLHAYHYDLVYKNFPNELGEERKHKTVRLKNPAFKMFESFVLESIIYKCNKCDIHFLSSSIAKDHKKHMELLINWKCSICRRIFKKNDKHLHLKQHNFSKTLNVCQFSESELSRLLYNCTKCAIHFREDRYLEHFSKCQVEVTGSVYCKICDILIDKCGYKSHETYHRMGKNTSDFTIIAADLIEVTKSKEIEVDKKRKRLYQQVNCLTFCQTCKCFLTDMGLTRKTHIESRCSEIPKLICRLCGLFLTHKALATHKEHHKKQNDLKLQDFKFFDLKGIQINPPIPEYPRCTNCDVTFVRKNEVTNHLCSEIKFLTCPICKIKLSENAFKLHTNFHNYSMQNTNKDTSQAVVTLQSQKRKTETERRKSTDTASNAIIEDEREHDDIDTVGDNSKANFVYSCQSCKISVDTYDKVIEHCQNHFSPIPRIHSTLKICSKCSLKFESDIFENHQKLHMRYDTIIFSSFDPTYFTSDNNTWLQHIFASKSMQKEVVKGSIYQHECRIKMEVVQKGPSHLTVYKCDKCGNFIDTDCIFAHVTNACPKNIRKKPCSVCGIPLMSTTFRNKHEKIHRRYDSIRLKSYNIVLFNSESHSTNNNCIIKAVKQFVIYQCRTCDGVVDKLQRSVHQCNFDSLKKCSVCGLLIYKDDFDRHVSKHRNLVRYDTANMKLILFGNKDESNQKKILSSFGGKIFDYTLYKCAKCEVCVNNETSITKHVCTFDNSKWKCPKCSFYICGLHTLKQHIELHDLDSEYKSENINVISFDLNKSYEDNSSQTGETHSLINENDNARTSEQEPNYEDSDLGAPNVDRDKTKPNDEIGTCEKSYDVEVQESVALYKCACGLHYMDKINAKTHVECCSPKVKVIRQSCSKCSLVFNPKELFSHLIAHHGEKNKTYKFDIVEISKDAEDIV